MSNQKQEAVVEKLKRTRQRLLNVARKLDSDSWTHPVYTHDEEWSALDVLRHLADAERGMQGTMENILEGGGGVPEDFDLARWNRSRVARFKDKMPAELLAEMHENRQALLEFIDTLDEDDWEKEGRHASLRIMTVEEILHQIANHEQAHLDDLREALTLPPESK